MTDTQKETDRQTDGQNKLEYRDRTKTYGNIEEKKKDKIWLYGNVQNNTLE